MEFVYVSPVKGKLVPRYSTIGNGQPTYIGAKPIVDLEKRGQHFEIDESKIVRIPRSEWTKFIKEYSRAVREKSLIERTEADFEKQAAKAETQVAKKRQKKGAN